jgi:hypothetical protein
MKFKTKSVLISRKKREKGQPECDLCRSFFINLFDINDPHKTSEVPKKMIEFDDIHRIIIKDLYINYLSAGKDIVINNLDNIEVKKKGNHLFLKGKQIK